MDAGTITDFHFTMNDHSGHWAGTDVDASLLLLTTTTMIMMKVMYISSSIKSEQR